MCLLRRLGIEIPLIPPDIRCNCSKHPTLDRLGTYLIACTKGNAHYITHYSVKFEINHFSKSCGLLTQLEPHGAFRAVDAGNGLVVFFKTSMRM